MITLLSRSPLCFVKKHRSRGTREGFAGTGITKNKDDERRKQVHQRQAVFFAAREIEAQPKYNVHEPFYQLVFAPVG